MTRFVDIDPNGRFAAALVQRMEQRGVTVSDLAARTGSTYEHARKLAKGLAFPSKHLLRAICTELGLSLPQTEELIVADKFERQFGDAGFRFMGRNPELSEIERDWPALTADQKAAVTSTVKAFARGNRKAQKSRSGS